MKAWHFIDEDKKLRYNDGRSVVVGETLKVDESRLGPCQYGLHASVNILDALKYSPGTVLCKVELSGKIIKESDKACASERKVLWMLDISKELVLFACDCATRSLKHFEKAFPEDKRPRQAIEAAREYILKGGDISKVKDAAYAASNAAYNYASNAAANAAAYAAAYAASNAAYAANAANAATYAASYAASNAAANATAYAASYAAEKQWQKKRLMYYINKARKESK